MTVYVATKSLEYHDRFAGRDRIIAGRTFASADSEAYRQHPDAFEPAERGERGVEARAYIGRSLTADNGRLPLKQELRVRKERVAELDREDADRDRYRYESASAREDRLFWEECERALAEPVGREPDLYRIDHLLAEEAQAELDALDAEWRA